MDYKYMPFYFKGSALSGVYYLPETDSEIKDFEHLMELYPKTVNVLMEYVSDECNGNEYEGSPIYDEYPDRLILQMMTDKIYGRMKDDKCSQIENIASDSCKDMINVLLLNEMYKRRCHHKRRQLYSVSPLR